VIPDKVLDVVAENYRHRNDFKDSPAIIADEISDDVFLPIREFGEAIRLTTGLPKKKARIKVKAFVKAWRDKLSRLRPGEMALRPRQETSTDASRSLIESTVWRVGDGRAILRGEESKNPSIGRPGIRRPTALTNDEARTLVERHLLQHGPQIGEKFLEFCKEHFIHKRQRRWVINRLKIHIPQVGGSKQTARYYCLPGQAPPNCLSHSPVLSQTVEFLKKILATGEKMPRKKIERLWRQRGFNGSDSVLVKARPLAGVVSERSKENRHHAIWSLARIDISTLRNGHGTNGHAEPVADSGENGHPEEDSSTGRRRQPSPPKPPTGKGSPGRPARNADLLEFVQQKKKDDPRITQKEILSLFKKDNPDHPIFQAEQPVRALKSLLSKRRKAKVS
jgi:hypothetical protein